MADNTQGKATQKDPAAGTNPGAQDAGAKVAASRDRTATRRARADAPRQAADSTDRDDRPTAEEIAKREPKTYRATDRGYADGKIIEPGEVFTTRADVGKWMKPIKKGEKYGVDMATEEASYARKVDIDYEGMSQPALEVMAAMAGVSKPGALSKDELITAIRAARVPQAQ
jgi:hypothetical protein